MPRGPLMEAAQRGNFERLRRLGAIFNGKMEVCSLAWANLKTRQFRDFRATTFTRTVPWEYERPLPLHMIDNWSKIDRILLPNKAAMLFIGKRRRTAQKRRQKTPPKNAQNGVRTRFFAAQRTAHSFETQLLRTCCHVAALLEKVANFSDTAATLSRKMTVAAAVK